MSSIFAVGHPRRRARAGFTLLELLIAIVVIGVLAALALGKFADTKEKTYIAAQKNDLRAFTTAAELALDRDGDYPATPEALAGFRYSDHVSTFGYATFGDGFHLVTQHAKSATACGVTFGPGRANKISCGSGATVSLAGTRSGSALSLTAEVEGAAGKSLAGAIAGRIGAAFAVEPAPLTAAEASQVEFVTWDFGDGTRRTSTGAEALTAGHTYADGAEYPVRAAVALTDGRLLLGAAVARSAGPVEPGEWSGGGTGATTPDTTTAPEAPANRAPVAAFTWSPTAPVQGETVTFDATTSSDPDGDALAYAWDSNDWTTAEGAQVTPTFATSGTHSVRLIVADPAGAADTLTQDVTIQPPAPQAVITQVTVPAMAGSPVALSGEASTGTSLTYQWTVAGFANQTASTASYTFASEGSYPVLLTVTDAWGRTVTASVTVEVGAAALLAKTLDVGGSHTCSLADDGRAYCWGYNAQGQVGDGTTDSRTTPTLVSGERAFTAIASGGAYACALTSGGVVRCWGFNAYGQLGDGTTTDRSTPTMVSGGPPFAAVATGVYHTCGLTSTGAAYCWGANGGKLGDGTTTQRLIPTLVTGGRTFTVIVTGDQHTCGLTSTGAAYCWGNNSSGQLGDGTTTQRLTPTLVTGGRTFTTIVAGTSHTCGLTSTGAAYCWGNNSSGQLGDGTTTQRLTSTLVTGGRTFTAIAAGSNTTCSLTNTGAAYCWGYNYYGQLGDGTTTDRSTPTLVTGGRTFTAIAAGGSHTCSLTNTGAAHCWGRNSYGQLGNGTMANALVPDAVSAP